MDSNQVYTVAVVSSPLTFTVAFLFFTFAFILKTITFQLLNVSPKL